ncbi:hypothetical protein [Kitasatospora sp. NPDC005856]|uniref:hypothetical protein n=1 Tax=Kitasatospora sp. NPDC005856 TaxID=3154566 RepID=UPI0033E2D4DF
MDTADERPAGTDHAGRPTPPPGGPARRTARRRTWLLGLTAAVVGALVLACTDWAGAGGDAAVIRQAELVGDWSNAAGATMHVSDDHGLTASGIRHAVPDYTCTPTLTAGTWQFWVRNGSPNSYTASASATEGTSFTISATHNGGTRCDLEAQVQRDGHGFDICLVLDPDQTCTEKELLRKDPARPR